VPWLLDLSQPNLHWRVLTEVIRRPSDSPAVVRARGGANAIEPVATLLKELMPDGSWASSADLWEKFAGPGWRLLAAVSWGADPSDPRLHAASLRLLEEAPGVGGFAASDGGDSVPWLTARVLQALARLGWCRHSRFQEAVAWLDEAAPRSVDGGWIGSGGDGESVGCGVTPVALLDALTACGATNRKALRDRAVRAVLAAIAGRGDELLLLGYPNFARTDAAEALAVLARAEAGYDPKMLTALTRLQQVQLEGGRWARGDGVPASLPVGDRPTTGEPSRWITLEAVTAILHYAVEAGLPRMFPQKPL
jgi:hypothetical protein